MKIWYYEDFKVLIAEDAVISVKAKNSLASKSEKVLAETAVGQLKLPEVDSETFEDILGALEEKTAKVEDDKGKKGHRKASKALSAIKRR